jgi:hypothetical protein
MQAFESTGGLTDYGAAIALALVVVWATLLIPLCRSKLNIPEFLAASGTLAFMIMFFWLWPTITEISEMVVAETFDYRPNRIGSTIPRHAIRASPFA